MKIRFKKTAVSALLLGLFSHPSFAEDITLRFLWWGGQDRNSATVKAIALFQARNPGIKIKPEYAAFSGYDTRLNTRIANHDAPDIMQLNWSWLRKMSRQQDALLDLNPYKEHLQLSNFPNDAWKSGLVNGHLVGLPMTYTAMVFLWNKTMFDRAGIPLPKTWDQLLLAGQIFKTKLGPNYYPLASDTNSLMQLAHAYIQQKTGKPYIYPNQAKVALTPEEVRDWLSFYADLYRQHVAMPTQEKYDQKIDGKAVEQLDEWRSGKWAGNYTWDSTLKLRQSAWNTGMNGELGSFLTMPGARSSGMYGRPSVMISISKETKHPEAAVRFIDFLLSDSEAAKELGMSRGTPMTRTQFDTLQKNNLIQGLELKAYRQIADNKMEYPSPLFEAPKVQKLIKQTFEDLARNRMSIDEAVTVLTVEVNRALRELK